MVKWTAHAKAQLRHIHDYIAEDSPLYAKRVTAALVKRTVDLDRYPAKAIWSQRSTRKLHECCLWTISMVSVFSVCNIKLAGQIR